MSSTPALPPPYPWERLHGLPRSGTTAPRSITGARPRSRLSLLQNSANGSAPHPAARTQDRVPPPAEAAGLVVRPAGRPGDAEATAILHRQYLGRGFLTRLGLRFLRRWHECIGQSEHGVSLIAVDRAGVVLGFLLGSSDQHKLVADLVGNSRRRLLGPALLGLLLRPQELLPFLRNRLPRYVFRLMGHPTRLLRRSCSRLLGRCGSGLVRRSFSRRLGSCGARQGEDASARSTAPDNSGENSGPTAVVTAIVVDPAARRRGVGAALLNAYLAEAAAHGATTAALMTVDGPTGAGDFYESEGWTYILTRADADGTPLRLYRRNLLGDARSHAA